MPFGQRGLLGGKDGWWLMNFNWLDLQIYTLIENNVKRQRIDTILRFVNALDARMSIKIKLNGEHNEFEMVF